MNYNLAMERNKKTYECYKEHLKQYSLWKELCKKVACGIILFLWSMDRQKT